MTALTDENPIEAEAASAMARILAPGLDDPYPLYAWLRTHAPVYFSEALGAYVLTRYADCERVLRNPADFPAAAESDLMRMLPQAGEHEAYRVLLTSVVNRNPPDHTRLRRLVARAFTPRRIEALKPDVDRIAAGLVAEVAARGERGGTVDLHSVLAVPVPLHVVAQLLGVPEEDRQRLADLVPRMINVIDPAADHAAMADADQAFHELGDCLWQVVEARRKEPRDDLISALVAIGEQDGDRLTDDELRTMLFTLWAAGFETAATAIDICVLTLLAHPEHRQSLQRYEDALRFVDEVLRWDVAGQISTGFRFAARDTDFGGFTVPAGAQIRLLFGAANRDPEVNPDPDRFDPFRENPRSLAFATGIHHCLGVNLARMEMAAVLTAIATSLPGLALAGPPVRRRSVPLRDFLSVPVRV
ncbi:cytochrome P450 [Streptomyces sp. NPDC050636]|uniref:cytochrome P450 n=1 Tax=Streptomyces sp. NPDC050636 TaxID=3154510 RepID=UPI003440C7D8